MLKKYTLICLALLCFKTQSQTSAQNDWERNLNVLEETLPLFDIKLYDPRNPDIAIRIKNYTIENGFLVVSLWERATKRTTKSNFDWKCLRDIEFTCETSCTLTLVFGSTVTNMNNKKTRIELSNCEEISKKNCNRLTWKSQDDFVKKSRQIFEQIIDSNRNKN